MTNYRMNGFMALCFGLLIGAASSPFAGENRHGHGNGHKAAHGGSLNAIEECAAGHAEVKLEDGVLRVWFVGGDGDTETAVRVRAAEIPLLATADGGETVRALTLKAKPLALAEETIGDCSHFTAEAEWLEETGKFLAVGVIKFKGVTRTLRIEYPKGYEGDHDHDHDHDRGHERHGKKHGEK